MHRESSPSLSGNDGATTASVFQSAIDGLFLQGAVLGATQARTMVVSDEWLQLHRQRHHRQLAGVADRPLRRLFLGACRACLFGLEPQPPRHRRQPPGGQCRGHQRQARKARRLHRFRLPRGARRLGGVSVTIGSTTLLYAVAAPVIGGISLFGGRGRVVGMPLITVIQTGLQLICLGLLHPDDRRSDDPARDRRRRLPHQERGKGRLKGLLAIVEAQDSQKSTNGWTGTWWRRFLRLSSLAGMRPMGGGA